MGCRVLIPSALVFLMAAPCMAQAATEADAEALVKKAIAFAEAHGAYKLIKEINAGTPVFKQGELYLWVVDFECVTLAHGANPTRIGKQSGEQQDASAVRFVQEAVKVAQDKGHGWIEYSYTHPETRKIEYKICYVEKFDEVVIACGVYKKK